MKKFICFMMAVCIAFSFAENLEARRGGGGFSRSSSSSSRSSSSSSRSSSSVSKSTSKPVTSSNARPAGKTTTATTKQQEAYNKAKSSGKAFTSRADATAAFKKQNADKYPSSYKTQPATRPSHIPEKTTVDGKSVNVTYNSNQGGYGYVNPVTGAWMAYSVMSDMAMMSMLMDRQGYYVGTPPATTVVSSGPSIFSIVLVIFIVVALGIGVVVLCEKSSF